jgi:phosphoribosyl 1,2-cyclic phosphodiesterase
VEAGIEFKKVMQAVNFNIINIAGCLSTHIHSDHSRSIEDMLKYNISVLVSNEHNEKCGIKNSLLKAIKPNDKIEIDKFSVIPFDVPHDVPCLGFLIHHAEMGATLFATDTCYLPCTFSNLNNILIECNYRKDILDENIRSGRIQFDQIKGTLSHMSYETCLQTLLANDLSAVNNIVLIHLSDINSNAGEFQRGIHEATGKTVHIAEKGMIINFNKTPF